MVGRDLLIKLTLKPVPKKKIKMKDVYFNGVNPTTGKKIDRGGPTYKKLVKQGYFSLDRDMYEPLGTLISTMGDRMRLGRFKLIDEAVQPIDYKTYYTEIMKMYAKLKLDRKKIEMKQKKSKIETSTKYSDYVTLRFISDGVAGEKPNYYTRSIYLLNGVDKFIEKIEKLLDGKSDYATGSDIMHEKVMLDMSFFGIWYLKPNLKPLGGLGSEHKTHSKFYIVKDPITSPESSSATKQSSSATKQSSSATKQSGDCFFGCMRLVKSLPSKQKNPTNIRKELDIVSKGVCLPLIPKLELFYNRTINVLSDNIMDDYLYEGTSVAGREVVELLLKDEHYSLIVRKRVREVNKMLNRKAKADVVCKDILLLFDFETIYVKTDSSFLKAYSCSYFEWDPEVEFIYDEKIHKPVFHAGFDCVDKLVEKILSCPDGYRYLLIGYNNSGFDNFFLADSASKVDAFSSALYVNGRLNLMKIGRHVTLDMIRFMAGGTSLDKACIAFNTKPRKVEGFSHDLPQKAFDDGGEEGLFKWVADNRAQLEKYNDYDTLSLMSLTQMVRNILRNMTTLDIFRTKGLFGTSDPFSTINQLCYSNFLDSVSKTFCDPDSPDPDAFKSSADVIPKPKTYEDDKWIRKAMYAGRVQTYYGKFCDTKRQYRMVDITSQYPFVMTTEDFPIGHYELTDQYMDGYLGIYECDIIHQRAEWIYGKPEPKGFEDLHRDNAPAIVARRSEDKPLDWADRDFHGGIVLCSVDIEMIKKWCGSDAIKIKKGLYWKSKAQNGLLFKGYMEPFKKCKMEQDVLKDSGSSDYNAALREIAKLCCNAMSGKPAQRNFDDMVIRVKNEVDLDKFLLKVTPEEISVLTINNNLTFFKGKLKEDKIYKSGAKPSYLAVFIYAYARRYIYEKVLGRYITIYQDTDSALMPMVEYERFTQNEAVLCKSQDYGGFKEEIGDVRQISIIAPKNYLVEAMDENKSKRKFKGVGKNDTWMRLVDIPQFQTLAEGKNTEEIKDMLEHNKFKLNLLEILYIRKTQKTSKVMNNDMFNCMFKNEKIVVFSSQLKRISEFSSKSDTNSDYQQAMSLGAGRIGIKQIYLIKIF
jgi:hypothetical protein